MTGNKLGMATRLAESDSMEDMQIFFLTSIDEEIRVLLYACKRIDEMHKLVKANRVS